MDQVDAAAPKKTEDGDCEFPERRSRRATRSSSNGKKVNLRNTSYVNAIGKDAEDLLVNIAESIGLQILHNVENKELSRKRGDYHVNGHKKSQNSSRTPKSVSRFTSRSSAVSSSSSSSSSSSNSSSSARRDGASSSSTSTSTSSSNDSGTRVCDSAKKRQKIKSVSRYLDNESDRNSTEVSYESGISVQYRPYNLRKTVPWQKKYTELKKVLNSRSNVVMAKVVEVLSKFENGRDEEELFCDYLKMRLYGLNGLDKHVMMFKLHEVMSRELGDTTFGTIDVENVDAKPNADLCNFDIKREIGKMKKQIEKLETQQTNLKAVKPAAENVLSCI